MHEVTRDGSQEWGEQRLLAELVELSVETAPRRFALGLLDIQQDDGAVVGWGLDFGNEAIAYVPTGGSCQRLIRAETADRARRLVARRADVRLIWLDSPVPQEP
ncbi:hypothetical protein [Actinoallomurus sp. NPDC050550]|uniref:hypothetical protein n=1 Tax=Actinoallomurus sp. NPDC050550 TaxID=3154937 RepID=UPI00340789A7